MTSEVLRLVSGARPVDILEAFRSLGAAARVEWGLRRSTLPITAARLGVELNLDATDRTAYGPRRALPGWAIRKMQVAGVVMSFWPFGNTCLRRALVIGSRVRAFRAGAVPRCEGVRGPGRLRRARMASDQWCRDRPRSLTIPPTGNCRVNAERLHGLDVVEGRPSSPRSSAGRAHELALWYEDPGPIQVGPGEPLICSTNSDRVMYQGVATAHGDQLHVPDRVLLTASSGALSIRLPADADPGFAPLFAVGPWPELLDGTRRHAGSARELRGS